MVQLFYSKLPHDIASRYCLLLDPMLATGGSANKAIDVLLDQGVQEDRILYVSISSNFCFFVLRERERVRVGIERVGVGS
jgi:uracil phosphoribosyltransferase